MSRDEHIAWCKERALDELNRSGTAAAIASMMSDLGKCGVAVYSPDQMKMLASLGVVAQLDGEDSVRHWIEGFQ